MNAGSTRKNEPNVAGIRVRPYWSLMLYVLLVLSAALAMYAQRAPEVDPRLARFAPWPFLVFAVGFAAYRVALVGARRYTPFKAFVQIFLAALFFLLMVFPRVTSAPVSTGGLLADRDPRIRALSAELLGYRNDVSQASHLVGLLSDDTEAVRRAAHEALVKLNGGVDLGDPGDASARRAWGERFP
jgi:hypothetical protein